MQGYDARPFSAPLTDGKVITHDVYSRGESPACVVIIQELPGIGQETLHLADTFAEQGFRVVLPHLFGPLGRTSMLGNTIRVMCMRKEFALFEANRSSPVVDWLKALCRDLRDTSGVERIGVIGMCLSGNFAISMMADDSVLAGVASQPSLPVRDHSGLHMSEDEVAAVRGRLDEHGPMMALRFEQDPLCSGARFRALAEAFNDDAERIRLIELPGRGHSVLTLDLYKRGHPAQEALQQVIGYFIEKLQPGSKAS